jgi:multiple sugar transport system substrate-binding protein
LIRRSGARGGATVASGCAAAAVCAAAAIALGAGCTRAQGGGRVPLRFWAMGREGEVVQEILHDFESRNPGIGVEVQQIPWSAAHEKLLTAHVGRASPDLAQLGNTWIAEFSALDALEPLDARIAHSDAVDSSAYFPGIWDTNVIDGVVYGVPWYVDTRVLFYRKDMLARAGYAGVPETWDGWREAMRAVRDVAGSGRFAIFLPLNEWPPLVIFGLQAGSPLLVDHNTRGAFSQPEFRRAFAFFMDLFRERLAPPVANTEIANLYQEFARGYFSMYITGPWNLGEFARRLPDSLQDAWATAPMPGPDGPGVSLAGGSSLVLYRSSNHKDAAWKVIEYLSRPDVQARFYELCGDLPAREEVWADSALASDPNLRTFGQQLRHVVPTPKIPEWEQIASRLQERSEEAVRGGSPPDSVLAALDRDVDRILEKRRWLLEHGRLAHGPTAEAGP